MRVLLATVGILILWIAVVIALLRVLADLTRLTSVPPDLSEGELADVDDDSELPARLRAVREMVDERRDVAAASLIESWIDDAERRTWFLFETTRSVD
jgi:starvation-inducible DNA-binding protein